MWSIGITAIEMAETQPRKCTLRWLSYVQWKLLFNNYRILQTVTFLECQSLRGSFFPFGGQQKLLLGKLPRFFSTQCFSSHSSVWHASNESLVSHPAEWTSQTEVKEGLVKEIPQLREHLFDQRLSSETHSWSAFTGGWIFDPVKCNLLVTDSVH